MTIFAFWKGGGQVKQAEAAWTIDELIAVGGRFPDLCSATPSKSFAILKKYEHLASFQQQAKSLTPLSYESASLFTAMLLDAFLQYKTIFKNLNKDIQSIGQKTLEFDPNAGNPDPSIENPFKPSLNAKGGLIDARADLVAQTAIISSLVDEITRNPDIVKTFTWDNPPRYMDPIRWQLRLPTTRTAITNRNIPHEKPATRASFSASSSNVHLEYTLRAACLHPDGVPQQSSISLNQIVENDQGSFNWAPPTQRGSNADNLGASARNLRLADSGRRLEGELLYNGRWYGSSIELDERIANRDGVLTCT